MLLSFLLSFFLSFFFYRIFRIFSSVLIMYLSCFSLSTLCSAPLSLFVTNLCYASSTYTTKEYLVIMLNFFDLLHSVTNCFKSRSTCMHNFPSPASSQALPSDGIICDGNIRAFLTECNCSPKDSSLIMCLYFRHGKTNQNFLT